MKNKDALLRPFFMKYFQTGDPAVAPHFTSLVSAVQQTALATPQRDALVFLGDGDTETARLSYAQLDHKAKALAAQLRGQSLEGQRVLLMMPSGVDYVVGFLACLYARVIAVPVYPPTSSMHAERLAQIVQDCNAQRMLVSGTSVGHTALRSKLEPLFANGFPCELLAIDSLAEAGAHDIAASQATLQTSQIAANDLAYLQYTSGSTGQARGVMVTHGNLWAHTQHLAAMQEQTAQDVFVNWLPLFHDMGIIISVVQPFYMGALSVILPPMAFTQQPLRWLRAISQYRGTVSFAPNFAYDACLAALAAAPPSSSKPDKALGQSPDLKLDLTSWSYAGNGAEPVRASTLANFYAQFKAYGLTAQSPSAGFGMAETTLMVTCAKRGEQAVVQTVDAQALREGRMQIVDVQHTTESAAAQQTQQLVSSGHITDDMHIAIVATATGTDSAADVDSNPAVRCPERVVGEIWIKSPIVAAGYWQRPELTKDTFHAYLPDGSGPYLRTGDLGVVYQQQLYITGRCKDVIIVRGKNHYPQDIEHTVFAVDEALEHGRGAAFSIEEGGQERLVIVQEIKRTWRNRFDGADLAQRIRAAVAEHHGLQVYAIRLVKPATVPMTSSGKIQRQACKALYVQNQWEPLFAWHSNATAAQDVAQGLLSDTAQAVQAPQALQASNNIAQQASQATAADADAITQSKDYQSIMGWLNTQLATRLGVDPSTIDKHRTFLDFDLDSMGVALLSGQLSKWLNFPIETSSFFKYPTVHLFAKGLVEQMRNQALLDKVTAQKSTGAGAAADAKDQASDQAMEVSVI
jgi:phthiocerol/phenolphthiocerol synthesis type-I polyketide synthase C